MYYYTGQGLCEKENICGCVSAIHGSPVELHAGFGASCKECLPSCVHQRMKCVMLSILNAFALAKLGSRDIFMKEAVTLSSCNMIYDLSWFQN